MERVEQGELAFRLVAIALVDSSHARSYDSQAERIEEED